ncbi:epoxide hydrolase family protein [Kutzneria sp. 744]|uniref:epoxide hydrolase family protein n=1 Tax=Kutzneria sp. (strain 744) TaxID=345341 RepID=UPI0003EEA9BC|nr:epoxide hydrolase family protein [Kutzneria sp. 744]EWM17306.1 epoxide hydrolase [Kutzneria sp. 744]
MKPFRISVPTRDLDDLRERLARTRFAPALSADWTHGTPPGYLAELVEYWRTKFDWSAAEAKLNEMPQFTASVRDSRLHFVHVEGKGPAPLPLLFSHGWPGSFWEVSKIIGPLTDPAAHGGDPADAFTVVAPSLPGYGFSEHPGTPGIGPVAIADRFHELMTDVLGYGRYAAQGGDWGSIITTCLGRDHSDQLAGIHVNMMAARPVVGEHSTPLTEAEQAYLDGQAAWRNGEGAYAQVQSSKPATLGAGLSDSPAGLAAWIVEKFRTWSDCGGDVESVFSKDDLLTNISIYWLTNSIATSTRLYYEAWRDQATPILSPGYIDAPTAYASFPHEIARPPREWVARAYNLQRFTEFERGGHFAAMEQPAALVEDIRAFYRELRD